MIHVKYLIIYKVPLQPSLASLVAQRLKHKPAMRETWVWSLGEEDSLEKEMATHSSILAWGIPWMEKPGGLQSTGLQRVGSDWATSLHFTFPKVGFLAWTPQTTCLWITWKLVEIFQGLHLTHESESLWVKSRIFILNKFSVCFWNPQSLKTIGL